MANWSTFLVGLLIFCVENLCGQSFNRPVPTGVPPYEFVRYDTAYHGHYLSAPFKLGAASALGRPSSLMILDADGYLVWYKPIKAVNLLDFKYDPVQQRYSFVNFQNPNNVRFTLMDADFQSVDSFTTVNGISPDVHDFQTPTAQSVVLAGSSDSIMDLSGHTFNGAPGHPQTHAMGFVVQEFDADHQLTFQWNSNDHIHPSQAYGFYGYSAVNFDYCHGNSIEVDAEGDFLVSFRHLNAVYKIRRSDGGIAWRLGGKSSSFTFANDPGFSGQHDARWLPNGNIALFDNANTSAPPRISRAVEYRLDTVNWTATKVWEYQHTPSFFSSAMGGHQTTQDRLHLINYGLNFRPRPSFVLVEDNGNLLSKLSFQDSFMSYRSYIFDLPLENLQRPVIHCSQQTGAVALSAPSGLGHYEWSNGAKTATIVVQTVGTYQVWVEHGTSMLGSQPFQITDLSKACPVSGTQTPESYEQPLVLGYFDLLGRKIQVPQVGEMLIVQYNNGQAKLKIWDK